MIIKILIIEDEKLAQEHLARLITSIMPDSIILEKIDSIEKSVEWLQKYEVDLIFLDIHLTDGLSFKIFEEIKINTPIIFTTAYDEYALKAFKLNSIDYLLKPLDEDDLKVSINKFQTLKDKNQSSQIQSLIKAFREPVKSYQERFIVSRGEKLLSVTIDQIAYFEGEDRYVYLIKNDGSKFIVDYRLSDLESLLDPKYFFRLNRSFIIHFDAIHSMVNVSKSRIKVELKPKSERKIIISSENSADFKNWLNR